MIKHAMRVGETIEIGGARIRLEHKTGQQVSLVIDAPPDVLVNLPKKQGQDKPKTTLGTS